MVFDPWSAVVLVGLLCLVCIAMWVVIPRMRGVRALPARRKWIQRAMELADVQPGETVYDLGSGDGRAMVVAAREFGARAVVVEIEPVHCAVAWLRALFSGVIARVSIRCADLRQVDLADADVVFLYLAPVLVDQIRPQLQSTLRPGARVVSLSFPFEGWQPAGIDIGHLIFLYRMPPQRGSIETYMRSTLT
jgi:SAM-dependent methyltransferase